MMWSNKKGVRQKEGCEVGNVEGELFNALTGLP